MNEEKVIKAIEDLGGEVSASGIAWKTGLSLNTVRQTLAGLIESGKVVKHTRKLTGETFLEVK